LLTQEFLFIITFLIAEHYNFEQTPSDIPSTIAIVNTTEVVIPQPTVAIIRGMEVQATAPAPSVAGATSATQVVVIATAAASQAKPTATLAAPDIAPSHALTATLETAAVASATPA
jgi:hypothetical protein